MTEQGTHMTNKLSPKPFARIFDSEKYGQILVTTGKNDDDKPSLFVAANTHPEHLQPTTITIVLKDKLSTDGQLEKFTLEIAERFAAQICESAQEFVDAWDDDDGYDD